MTVDNLQRILQRLQKVMVLLRIDSLELGIYSIKFDIIKSVKKDGKWVYESPYIEDHSYYPVVISLEAAVQLANFDTLFGRTLLKLNHRLDQFLLNNYKAELLKRLDIEYMDNRELLTNEELDIKDILE